MSSTYFDRWLMSGRWMMWWVRRCPLPRFTGVLMIVFAGLAMALSATVTGLLALVAVGASLVPALRATRVDPVVALKAD